MPRTLDSLGRRGGFSLLELLVVIVIIGILAALGYSSLSEIIYTSRAKETAQTIRTFAERALAEGKRQNEVATLKLDKNNIQYTIGANTVSAALSNGFNEKDDTPTCVSGDIVSFNNGVQSKLTVGLSSLDPNEGYFAACDTKGYCGAAIKTASQNSFIACIKRKNGNWEVL
jgi:prepilin-type N-terminal cleavage/methylation domain-containing protein